MTRCGEGGSQSQGEVQRWGAALGHRGWERCQEALAFSPYLPQPHDHKLSDQREALSRGQNPLPIYCALNTKERNLTTFEFGGE